MINYGKSIAIIATFFASCILHGLNFQLGAVLMSLGFFAFVEIELRSALYSLFGIDLSVTKRSDERPLAVRTINLLFGLLTMINLAYLGSPFDQSQSQEEGYSGLSCFNKWKSLEFFSHLLMIILFLITLIMRKILFNKVFF